MTMREVAVRAGVALSSVSRVLNNHPDVSESMRAKVLTAVSELSYEPNLIASSLRRGSTMTVGFIVADISNPLFAEFSKGAATELDLAGYTMVLANSEFKKERDAQLARLFRWRRVDGLIISLADQDHPETIAELQRLEAPIVLFDRDAPQLPQASTVTADHAGGIRRATDHLLDLGHRRIAMITGPSPLRPTQERMRGFWEAYKARNIGHPADLVRLGSFDAAFGEAAASEFLQRSSPPTAIISGSNQLLVGVLRALHRMGLRPGRDIALVSCDDVPLAELHHPPITIVHRDTIHMGKVAAELLLERIRDEDAPPRLATVRTELLVRDSTFPITV
ncbi:MAG: LacI family DNA-binding transcriptional regulator [Actinomycetota bacterium]|nr:LacI family DNA-binding transcriptional regulator [Actinomycetota bacterium]